MLESLSTLKDIMSDVVGQMDRNTAAIAEIGNAVINLGIAIEAGMQGAQKIHRGESVEKTPKTTRSESADKILEIDSKASKGIILPEQTLGPQTSFTVS